MSDHPRQDTEPIPSASATGYPTTEHPAPPNAAPQPTPLDRPTGPSIATMISGLVLVVVAAIVAAVRLADLDTGVPQASWAIMVGGGVLVVAGVLGMLMGRRGH